MPFPSPNHIPPSESSDAASSDAASSSMLLYRPRKAKDQNGQLKAHFLSGKNPYEGFEDIASINNVPYETPLRSADGAVLVWKLRQKYWNGKLLHEVCSRFMVKVDELEKEMAIWIIETLVNEGERYDSPQGRSFGRLVRRDTRVSYYFTWANGGKWEGSPGDKHSWGQHLVMKCGDPVGMRGGEGSDILDNMEEEEMDGKWEEEIDGDDGGDVPGLPQSLSENNNEHQHSAGEGHQNTHQPLTTQVDTMTTPSPHLSSTKERRATSNRNDQLLMKLSDSDSPYLSWKEIHRRYPKKISENITLRSLQNRKYYLSGTKRYNAATGKNVRIVDYQQPEISIYWDKRKDRSVPPVKYSSSLDDWDDWEDPVPQIDTTPALMPFPPLLFQEDYILLALADKMEHSWNRVAFLCNAATGENANYESLQKRREQLHAMLHIGKPWGNEIPGEHARGD